MKKRRGWLLTAAGLAAVMAAALTLAYQSRMLLPLWIRWESAHICGETAAEPDEILLRGRRATVCKGGAAVWQSERGVRVQDVLWCDIDHDGDKELMLLCWKRGRYGESRPFWVEEDEKSWSQHIYIYDWTEEGLRPIWMASDIGMDAERWRFDERERLVITERNGRESAWDWLTWGLSALGNPVRAG